jgi:hypothetical protein
MDWTPGRRRLQLETPKVEMLKAPLPAWIPEAEENRLLLARFAAGGEVSFEEMVKISEWAEQARVATVTSSRPFYYVTPA